jgi:hypothetical protein
MDSQDRKSYTITAIKKQDKNDASANGALEGRSKRMEDTLQTHRMEKRNN